MTTAKLQNATVDLEWGAQEGTLKVGREMPGLGPAQALGLRRLCDQARGQPGVSGLHQDHGHDHTSR